MKQSVKLCPLVLVAILATSAIAQDKPILDGFSVAVSPDGAIKMPGVDFRAEWQVLGVWSMDGKKGADGLHVVYAQPGVAQAYRKTGEFPDGAILIKELLGAKTKAMTTGVASYAHELSGWFVMVKDQNNRFPDNRLWGDGWGWSYFGADDPGKIVTKNYKAECKSCHVPARKTDWVFTYAYPVLK